MVRLAFVAPDDWTIWLFYRHLLAALQAEGAQVTAFSAPGPSVPRLAEMGIEHVAIPYARFVDPARDLKLYLALRREFHQRPFDVVQNVTIKANLYGPLAAATAGVTRVINTVEGAGLLYSDAPSPRVRGIRGLAEVGLKRAKRHVTRYWFVNDRDRDLFVQRGLASREQSVVAIATGVDTDLFDSRAVPLEAIHALRQELSLSADTPIVVNVAGRLLRSKGIGDFIEAGRLVRERGVRAQFLLVGPDEPDNPDAFPIQAVRDAVGAGIIKWIPFREDVWTLYAAAEVAVVPTYYAEGTPKGVLEGMAMGRPVVCSDVPSIRALVSDNDDAVLFPPRDLNALAHEIESLLASSERRMRLGVAARASALARFDANAAARTAVKRVYADFLSPPQAGAT
jgi:glycosyltransferase involved in cell wall biosynthesis